MISQPVRLPVHPVHADHRLGRRAERAPRPALAPQRRRQRDRARCVFRDSVLGAHIKDSPWTDMSGFSWRDARFSEYRNTGPGSTVTADRPQLTDAQAPTYTAQKYLAGPTAGTRSPDRATTAGNLPAMTHEREITAGGSLPAERAAEPGRGRVDPASAAPGRTGAAGAATSAGSTGASSRPPTSSGSPCRRSTTPGCTPSGCSTAPPATETTTRVVEPLARGAALPGAAVRPGPGPGGGPDHRHRARCPTAPGCGPPPRGVEVDLAEPLPPGHEALGVVVPWSHRPFQYTVKDVARPARRPAVGRRRRARRARRWSRGRCSTTAAAGGRTRCAGTGVRGRGWSTAG